MKTFLGIDPGRNGAAVLINGDRTLSEAWWWKPTKDGAYKVYNTGGITAFTQLYHLRGLFGHVERAAVEALFVGPARQTIIGTAETAGELVGAAMLAVGDDCARLLRPPASRWRSDLLRLPGGTKAAQADKYAKTVILNLFSNSTAWKCGHAIDAACLALWASGLRGKPRQK